MVSSASVKLGTSTSRSSSLMPSARFFGHTDVAVRTKNSRSRWRVCETRKSLIGGSAASASTPMSAVDNCPAASKWRACSASRIDIPTGAMMNSDRISAMPFSTRFGGTCWMPSAERSRPSTTTSFV